MHLVKSTTDRLKRFFLLLIVALVTNTVYAQDNSPYSRYGLGDLMPGQNIVNRGMGGISAAYSDYGLIGSPFNLNFTNPASLGNISNTKNFSNTIFDLGGEVDIRTLKSTSTVDKYTSKNTLISYFQVGFPISTKKMEKNGKSWGLSFGLRPITKINYKIEENGRISNIDSINTKYEGSGGVNQLNISTGFRIIGKGKSKNEFNIGFSSGYTFGNRNYSTKISLINDSVAYNSSNTETQSRFGGVFINSGVQYTIHLINSSLLRLGAYANFQQSLNAVQNTMNETFGYNAYGEMVRIDSVYISNDEKGKLIIPLNYGAGFTYQSKNKRWLIGVDYECSKWNDYRYFDKTDKVANNWVIRAGAEYYPAKFNAASNTYWNYVKYRSGFYYGPDYIKFTEARNNFAVSAGASLPLTTPRYIQSRGEFVSLNTSIEIGAKGNKTSLGLRENYARINFGISMNARWFQKRSYD